MSRSSGGVGPCCQVPGCKANVVKEGHYFVRRKVCRKHCTADEICVGDNVVRYCQQCSRVQLVDDFDAGRRSCRASLAAHSQRRRNRGFKAAKAAKAAAAASSPAPTGSAGWSGHNSQQTDNTNESAVPSANSRGSLQATAAACQDAIQLEAQRQQQQQQGDTSLEAQELEEEPWLLPLHMPPLHQMLALPQSPKLQPLHKPAAQQQRRTAPNAAAADAAARPQLGPGSVADALLAAIGTDMDSSALGYSMQGQQCASTSAAFHGGTAMGVRDAAHKALSGPPLLSGTKRVRDATINPFSTAQYLADAFLRVTDDPSIGAENAGLLQSVSNSGSMLQPQLGQSGARAAAVQQQRMRLQQQQQHVLSRQPPRMPQPAASESLRAALLSSLSAGLASSQGTEQDCPWPQQCRSSGGSGSGSNTALQRLVAALRTMPDATNVPALQLAVERQRHEQQLGSRQQPGMPHGLAQSLRLQPSNLVGPNLSSPSMVAGASLELSQSALTAPDMPTRPRAHQQAESSSSSSDGDTGPSTTLQRLTAVLKSLPPGGLPLLKAALQEAEQIQQEAALEEPSTNNGRYRSRDGLANASQARLQAAALLGQQQRAQSPQQGAVILQQQLAAGANFQRLLLQQQRTARPPPIVATAGTGADCRPGKRQALASTAGALRPAGVNPALQQLLGSAAAGSTDMGPEPTNALQPRANHTLAHAPGLAIRPGHDRLMIEELFPDNSGSLGTSLSGAPGHQG